MEKRILLVLILLLLIPTILAPTTTLKIKAPSYHRLYIAFLKTGEVYSLMKSFPFQDTGYTGEVSALYSTEDPQIDIKLILNNKEGNKTILTERFEGVKTGETVFINFFKDNVTITTEAPAPAVNETAVNQTTNETAVNQTTNETAVNQTTNETAVNEVINETNQTPKKSFFSSLFNKEDNESDKNITPPNFSITGNVVGFYKNNSKIIIYFIVTIVVIAVILFVFVLIRKMPGTSTPIKIRNRPIEEQERELSSAERKLKEAREEIEKIRKKQDMVREAEKQLEEDRAKLERLRRGF